ncbi:Crp/Fnr family transcriptional regulator [Desulfonatronovibrio hydrogenovorans]|uniref:Crp/Fnr family transcriptional regulator n=1 Tax=Desulfonatronovibrio hydrogenovorans TaxID=53245 RepID=UPI00048F1095|nr:Crp/Fnr family transcriptional regulator [Desulfonatronovibrio hydrogenovorans]
MDKKLEIFPTFSSLSQEHILALESIAQIKKVEAGQTIFLENDPGIGFYGITKGKIKIYKLSPFGKEHILHIFGPGEIFAEVAVFAGKNFPANALALEESTLLFFPRDKFRGLLADNPDLSLALLGLMSMRLRQMVGKVEELSLKEVPARLATHLLLLRENTGQNKFSLDINKTQLAALLGTIPETLSRVIRKMKDESLIKTSGNMVVLLDIQSLKELAEGGIRI